MNNWAAVDADRLLGESGMLAEPLERRRDMVARRNKEIAGKGAMIICGMDFVMRP